VLDTPRIAPCLGKDALAEVPEITAPLAARGLKWHNRPALLVSRYRCVALGDTKPTRVQTRRIVSRRGILRQMVAYAAALATGVFPDHRYSPTAILVDAVLLPDGTARCN